MWRLFRSACRLIWVENSWRPLVLNGIEEHLQSCEYSSDPTHGRAANSSPKPSLKPVHFRTHGQQPNATDGKPVYVSFPNKCMKRTTYSYAGIGARSLHLRGDCHVQFPCNILK